MDLFVCVHLSFVQECAELYKCKGVCKGMSKGVCVCVYVDLSSCPSVHMGVGLSHVPLVLTTGSGKSCREEFNVPSS